MPSSLTMVLPIALVCSTRLPVSVLVRAPPRSLEVFLGSMGSPASHEASSNVSACCRADLPALRPTRFHGDVQNPARLPFSVTPSVKRSSAVRECRPVVHRLRLPASP